MLDLAITVVPGADAAKLLEVGVKGAAKAGGEQAAFALVRWIAGKTDSKVAADLSDNALRDAFRARKTGGSSALRDAEKAVGCALCFPAGTLVTTAHGEHAIQTLHVGDSVQAENPATGKVEAEAVQAVIADPVSPLIAVDLSDGSAITVTADHPFWVDGGAQLAGAGWFAAGRLQAGDELRTAAGVPVMVVGLRRNVGTAVVYTLTVAKDHTFFVGAAQVLVHNADCFGREIVKTFTGANVFEAFGKARADAQAEARLGSDVVDFVSEIGPMKGKVVGRQSADGLRGWRLDWDPTNPAKGLHVNWWDKTGGAKRANWRFGANIVAGGTEHDYLYLLNRFPSP